MELERVILGLVVAVLLPYSVPALRTRSTVAVASSTLYSGYTLYPVFLSWEPFLLIPLCGTISYGLVQLARHDADMQGSPLLFLPAEVRKYTLVPLGAALIATLSTLAMYGVPEMLNATHEFILDNTVGIAVSGFLIATFVGGEVVTHTLHPFSAELKKAEEEEMTPLKGAGTVIGWLERSLTFLLVGAGQSEAVLAVVGIKALARFSELQANQKRFAEYFLIGTMSSIGFAVLVAATVRLAVGERALV